jgi:2-oxo-4-hydroxy-4-carboxy-5-ureidoimidazoline decarboxylase
MRVSSGPMEPMPMAEFDAADAADAAAELMLCCASRRWVSRLVHARPFHTLDRLMSASDVALRTLDWPDIHEALAGYEHLGVTAVSARMGNDAVAERQAVRAELSRVVRTRLGALFA